MYSLGGILVLILVLAAVVLIRALSLKPTSAKTANIELDNSQRAREYGRRLSKLIQKETVSARGDTDRTKFYDFHKELEALFPKVHQTCEKHEFDGSLLFKWKGKGNHEPILLMSHQDVVEAKGDWKHEPFSGDIDEKGCVWGRGTVDTKGSLFCIFSALEELIWEGYEPECDVYIASSCTEEISGEGAPLIAKYLTDQGVQLALLLDEGGMIVEEPVGGVKGIYGMVGVVEKGYGDVKFVAKSNGGHASAPGKNTPLVRLGKFMAEIDKNNPFTAKLTPTVREMFRRMTPNMTLGMRVIFANLWLFEGLLLKLLPVISPAAAAMTRTTIAFTTAKGANGLNVLPQEAYVTANMRFIHHQPNKESIALLGEIAKKYQIETEALYNDEPCPIVDYKSDAFHLIEDVAAEIYPGVGICPYTMTGGTDAKFYKEICQNAMRFAPIYIDAQQYSSIHGINENIYQGALTKAVDFYKAIIKKC